MNNRVGLVLEEPGRLEGFFACETGKRRKVNKALELAYFIRARGVQLLS